MTFLNKILPIIFCLLLIGCAKPKPITVIEYVEVKVPVKCKLDRPQRPAYTKKDTTPTYLLKLIEYATKLEVIIDEYNKDE